MTSKPLALLSAICMIFAGNAKADAPGPDYDSNKDKMDQAIKSISAFANEICVPHAAMSKNEIKSKLNGLEDELGNINVETSNKYAHEQYVGVLQDRLNGVTLDVTACKLKILNEWRDVFIPSKPAPLQMANVKIVSSGHFINNKDYGPIDGSISSLSLFINNKLVVKNYLDKKFVGFIKLPVGVYNYRFDADITGTSNNQPLLNDDCEGTVDIQQSTQFAPSVVFSVSAGDGVFQECDLVEQQY